MKALKIWSILLGIAAIALYVIGAATGIFNRGLGLLSYGTSPLALVLLTGCIFCALLCITCLLVLSALRKK